jgi:hypothetical protein
VGPFRFGHFSHQIADYLRSKSCCRSPVAGPQMAGQRLRPPVNLPNWCVSGDERPDP